jgi:hypothetical protein
MHFGLKHSKNCRCAACNTKLAQLVLDRAYNLMLDSAALQQQRLYIQDVVTYGTGVMSMTVDYTPCGCQACRRYRGETKPFVADTWVDYFVLAVVIVAGVAVALLIKRFLG